jgi:pyruvate formate lyase activating enzyme
VIGEGQAGYCGAIINRNGKATGGAKSARLSFYHDPLLTNCVASWVCPADTATGYPHFSYTPGPEYGYKNLAVFYESCNFNCLYCNNWHFRKRKQGIGRTTPEQLAGEIKDDTSCICFFGGDPVPSLAHCIKTARAARKPAGNRPLRICFETNGSFKSAYAKAMTDVALCSGGIIKFDLKAHNEDLHLALTGVSNRRTYENFQRIAEHMEERKDYPLLVASTLLVPGLVDEEEVYETANFISSLSPNIPYALLGFFPDNRLLDLPPTDKTLAASCKEAALQAGLENVKIGNLGFCS